MGTSTTIQIIRYFGLVVLFGGLITLGVVVPTLPNSTLQAIVAVFSLITVAIGYLWYKKVTDVARGKGLLGKKRYSRAREYAILLFLVVSSIMFSAMPVSYLQGTEGCSTDCLTYKRRVETIEYFMLSITVIAGLLAFGPIMFGRTILGPVFQELQYMAGAMFLVLLFFMLFLFPLHVMFADCQIQDQWGYVQQGCYIDMCALQTNGPPLTRFILDMITPPGYGCNG
jgi:hypothetical protein